MTARYVTIEVLCVDAHGAPVHTERVRAPTGRRARRRARHVVQEAGKLAKIARSSTRILSEEL